MKNKLTTLVPAVALLALSGCAGTSGLTSTTESDGVYYSSKDKTTQTATASIATDEQYTTQGQGIDEDMNPEYSNGTNSASSGSTEYYDDSYASRLGRFNNSGYSGLSYYSPVYTDPYFVGGGAFSPYYGLGMGYNNFYDPFYSSFYSPFGYGFGSSLSIGLGFGNSWGYRPYYGLGYGRGFYDGFYNPYYGGFGGYGLGYAYGNPYYYGGGYGGGYSGYNGSDYGRRPVRYAPRVDRTREAVSASQPIGGAGRNGRYVSQGGLIASPNTSGVVAPNTSVVGNAEPNIAPGRSRGRIVDPGASQAQQANGLASPNNYNINERVMSTGEQSAREGRMSRRMMDPSMQSADQPRIDYSGRGRRGQAIDNSSAGGSPTTPQDYQQPQPQRRSRFSEAFNTDGSNSSSQSAPRRTYESRTYEAPRTYSEPARMSSPSPSPSSSGGGGGSFGGGGGGGGRGRIR